MKGRVKAKGERGREIFQPWFTPQRTTTARARTKPKPEVRNIIQVSHRGGRNLSHHLPPLSVSTSRKMVQK